MIRRPPRSTRPDTPFPSTTLCRSAGGGFRASIRRAGRASRTGRTSPFYRHAMSRRIRNVLLAGWPAGVAADPVGPVGGPIAGTRLYRHGAVRSGPVPRVAGAGDRHRAAGRPAACLARRAAGAGVAGEKPVTTSMIAAMPPLRHIASTLYRQRLMPTLVVVQIALACAILVNAAFLLGQQLAPMLVPDGIAKDQVLLVDQLVSRDGQWRASRIEAGARALRAVPGVRAVTPALGLPMKQTMMMTYDLKGPGGVSVTASAFAGEGMLQSLDWSSSRVAISSLPITPTWTSLPGTARRTRAPRRR